MKVTVIDIIKSPNAAYHSEGLEVYAVIANALKQGQSVDLSFAGIEICSTMFLNASVGKVFLTSELAEAAEAKLSYSSTEDISNFARKWETVVNNALHHEEHDKAVDRIMHT